MWNLNRRAAGQRPPQRQRRQGQADIFAGLNPNDVAQLGVIGANEVIVDRAPPVAEAQAVQPQPAPNADADAGAQEPPMKRPRP